MGFSMRTDRYRFTEWRVPGKDFCKYELYDHLVEPKENVNIAKRPEKADLSNNLQKSCKKDGVRLYKLRIKEFC